MTCPRDSGPENRLVAAVAVRHALHAIDHGDEQQIDALVSDFLCAAWPTLLAQNQ